MSAALNVREQMTLLQRDFGEGPREAAPAPNLKRFQGVVDQFGSLEGLTGWCAALDRPRASVELELLIDGLVVARTRTGIPRADVCALTGLDGDFGFRFEPEVFDRFSAHRALLGDKPVAVRIAGSGLALSLKEEHARLSAIFTRREAYGEANGSQALLAQLEELQEAAAPMLLAPYRASQTAPCGCIELIAPGANGVLWIVGWARRDQARAFAAAILDRRKYRAGGLVAGFDREDLGAEASGFVGVLRTDWRPSPGREAILQIDGENGGQLRAIRALRLGRVRDALAHLERAASGEDAALAQPMLAFARANEDLDLAPSAGSRVKLAVDSAAVLEGFGVFMKGWIFSPMQLVKRLYLKLGDRQVEAEPQSLGFSPRPDLLNAFPNAREPVNRAGFCCVFPHDGAVALHAEAGLRIVYEDGGASFHPLPDIVIRRLQPDDEGGHYREFYPHMERQPLFAAYARAYYAQCEARYGQCGIEASAPAPIQLVFVAPRERNRLYLMFEELRQNLRRRRARGVGVVIVAGKAVGHGEIRELFHGLSRDFAGPCSLVLVEDSRFALWSLDGALVALGARRFVFVAAEVTLNDRGWEAMAGLLAGEPRLAFLDVSDPCEPWAAPQASMQAFVWTSEAFLDWRRQRRLPLGKAPACESEEGVGERRGACGVIERQAPPTAAIEAINFHAGAL